MKKEKEIYVCNECGYESFKWLGKCPTCQAWNSFSQFRESKSGSMNPRTKSHVLKHINDESDLIYSRLNVSEIELNKSLGDGFVSNAVYLLSGEPGIGKSTLVLHWLNEFETSNKAAIYFSGEESIDQIQERAKRLSCHFNHLFVSDNCDMEFIEESIQNQQADIIVIDSIQTLYSDKNEFLPGSISQIKDSVFRLIRLAKEKHKLVLLIGHINKDGQIAGPKVLEHMVDVVMQFEMELNDFRSLRISKNRFGPVNQLIFYIMQEKGLTLINPSLVSEDRDDLIGVSSAVAMEANKLIPVEVQALLTRANYGVAQRVIYGYDLKRLHLIIAVIEKYCGEFLGDKDIYIKLTAICKITDSQVDLAIIAAIFSSLYNLSCPATSIYVGEISLAGQIMPLRREEKLQNEFTLQNNQKGYGNFKRPKNKAWHSIHYINELKNIVVNVTQ